ncbi:NUDIX hydrolase [Aphanothece hegewaldii CCALA 016]|uniref:NUDIX hydrolase n=1 Tax=Aphanothece hegewaldii CCALA 016 TaxID=2107694 RepID=A0A2T1LSN4_9CHRO|nr:NUDIX hydrolase [Aphanothece hegewaldii]PSF33057.1 NUDIX hydrolase [Aphanothece hegewaldii CCALA 016]
MISSFPINSNTNNHLEVALAIIQQDGHLLMQLRDDFPHIAYPGHWGLFGGHLELGETPEEGLKRELIEEINYKVSQSQKMSCYADENVTRHIFYIPLTVALTELNLQEGQDLALLTPEDIQQGYAYSSKIQQSRPLGKIHQQILLDFLKLEL